MAFAAVNPKGMISGRFDCRRACVLSESIKSTQGGVFRLIRCCERLVGVSSRIVGDSEVWWPAGSRLRPLLSEMLFLGGMAFMYRQRRSRPPGKEAVPQPLRDPQRQQ
jgi:hypothetical protein